MNPMVLPGLVAPSRPLVAPGNEKITLGEGFRDALSRSEKGHRHESGRSAVEHEHPADNIETLDLKADTETASAEDVGVDAVLPEEKENTSAKRRASKRDEDKTDAPVIAQGGADKTPPPQSRKVAQPEGNSVDKETTGDVGAEPSDLSASRNAKEPALAPVASQEAEALPVDADADPSPPRQAKDVRNESAAPSRAESEPRQAKAIDAEPQPPAKAESKDAPDQSEPRNIHLRASANIAAMFATRSAQATEKSAFSGEVRQVQEGSNLRVVVNARSSLDDRFFDLRQKSFGSAVAMLHLSTRTNAGAAAAAPSRTMLRHEAAQTASVDALADQAIDAALETKVQADDSQSDVRPADDRADRRDRAISRQESLPDTDRDAKTVQSADKANTKSSEPTLPAIRSETVASVAEPLAAAAKPIGKSSAPVAVEAQAPSASGTQTLKIQLRPVELGEITAVLRMNGDSITVEISTEKMEAYDRLSTDSDSIVKALRGLGLQIDQVTVQPPQATTASAKGDAGPSGQQANGSGQQFAQTGGSSGEGSGGQRGTASQGGQRDDLQARNAAASSAEDRGDRGLVI
ncbi:MAG: flagellar hook-length control protein FliK [Rhizobiaceae bacterium]|nr:flagellar hook-length control protein FliK [Rhizobiaceae bacterium]